MSNKYSKLSIAGFALIILSVIIGQFFIFNNAMVRVLGRDVFDAVFHPLLISLFLTHIAGIVLSITGLVNSIRKKLKGKGFSIAGIVFFIVEAVVIIFCLGILFIVATGEKKPAETAEYIATETTVEVSEEYTGDPELKKRYLEYEYLRANLNADMSLVEIINVFEETCGQTTDDDLFIFKHGVGFFGNNGALSQTHDNRDHFYCFGLARQFRTDDGINYQICVDVLYGVNSQNRNFTLTQLTDDEVDGDFFDYIRNSDAYKYASTAEIRKLNIYITGV